MDNLSKLRTPYENIVIGNFLYGLGMSLGTRAGTLAPLANISNIQQTPLDPLMADVWLAFPGTCRLLEFKRKGSSNKKDRTKLKALAIGLDKQRALIPVSRLIHWYAEINVNEAHGIDLSMCPYLDFVESKTQLLAMGAYIDGLTKSIMDPAVFEPSPQEVSTYLRMIGELSTSGSASGGGLLVHISPEGAVRYLPLVDLRDLTLQYKLQLGRDEQLSQQIEKAREEEYSLALEVKARTHERNHGQEYER